MSHTPASHRTNHRTISSAALVAFLTLLTAACASPSDEGEDEGDGTVDAITQAVKGASRRCEKLSFKVALAPNTPATYKVVGWLCGNNASDDDTIQVLLHGSSYSHEYWDWPQQSERYSYAQFANDAGYATLNIDRLGAGESDKPASELLTSTAQAFTVHQIVQELRRGRVVPRFGRVKPDNVLLVGHSMGAVDAILEAATFADVDGVILTGGGHTFGPGSAGGHVYPAQLDPVTAPQNLPQGYLTTIPGLREPYFYNVAKANPAVTARDEATKQGFSAGEYNDVFNSFLATLNIHVPVLIANGNFDYLSCGGGDCTASNTMAGEAQYFAPDAHLETYVLPDSGHSINLHPNARKWFAKATNWADRHFGCRGGHGR